MARAGRGAANWHRFHLFIPFLFCTFHIMGHSALSRAAIERDAFPGGKEILQPSIAKAWDKELGGVNPLVPWAQN